MTDFWCIFLEGPCVKSINIFQHLPTIMGWILYMNAFTPGLHGAEKVCSWLYRKKLSQWIVYTLLGYFSMNTIMEGRNTKILQDFYRIDCDYPKDNVPKALQVRVLHMEWASPLRDCLIPVSRRHMYIWAAVSGRNRFY